MERLFIDFVGPLTRTKARNIAILVVDGFSKFVSFRPVRKISSAVVVEYLERVFFPAYGCPASIVTDNTTVFRSKQIRDLCFRWGVEHFTTTPYYPQASLAERVNRNLKAAFKIFHHNSQRTWDENLVWLSLAFNTAVHESHKNTPDVLFLGWKLNCPLQVRWNLTAERIGDP
jgi:transposase InsO family protein